MLTAWLSHLATDLSLIVTMRLLIVGIEVDEQPTQRSIFLYNIPVGFLVLFVNVFVNCREHHGRLANNSLGGNDVPSKIPG